MSSPKQNIKEQKIGFYITAEHECSYLPDKNARTLFADPDFPMNTNIYTALTKQGFRRSGKNIYKPKCHQCNSCIAIRLPVQKFIMNRNQKRNWARNKDLQIIKTPARLTDEYFELYVRYLAAKHPDGGMNNPTPDNFTEFLITDWLTTTFYEFRSADKLLSVAVVDEMSDGLSAVYTFYDPDYDSRSLGRYAVLSEIEAARSQDLPWLYLGYWIADCRKMQYKDEYQPLEYLYDEAWQSHPPKNTF